MTPRPPLHLCFDGQRREVRVRLLAREQLFSILAAVAVAREASLDLDTVLGRLAELRPAPAA